MYVSSAAQEIRGDGSVPSASDPDVEPGNPRCYAQCYSYVSPVHIPTQLFPPKSDAI